MSLEHLYRYDPSKYDLDGGYGAAQQHDVTAVSGAGEADAIDIASIDITGSYDDIAPVLVIGGEIHRGFASTVEDRLLDLFRHDEKIVPPAPHKRAKLVNKSVKTTTPRPRRAARKPVRRGRGESAEDTTSGYDEAALGSGYDEAALGGYDEAALGSGDSEPSSADDAPIESSAPAARLDNIQEAPASPRPSLLPAHDELAIEQYLI